MSRTVTLHRDPLVVQPKWFAYGVFLLATAGVVVTMVVMRRGELDVEDWLASAATILIAAWVFSLGMGSLVRSLRAGYALRLDAEGLHIPGADVIPWSAVESADRGSDDDAWKRLRTMNVHTTGLATASPWRTYERYLFGPLAGLRGYRGRVMIATGLLAIDPDALLAATRSFIEIAGARAQIRRNVADSAAERADRGRRLP